MKLDLIAQTFEPSHEVLLDHLPIVFVEVIAAQVLIGAAVTQQMIDDDQDTMADRDGGALGSASSGDAAVLRRQVGVLAVGGGVSGLDEELTRVGIAFPGLATESHTRTFMVAWTDADPGGQVGSVSRRDAVPG